MPEEVPSLSHLPLSTQARSRLPAEPERVDSRFLSHYSSQSALDLISSLTQPPVNGIVEKCTRGQAFKQAARAQLKRAAITHNPQNTATLLCRMNAYCLSMYLELSLFYGTYFF